MAQYTTRKRSTDGKAETMRRRTIRQVKRTVRPLNLDDFTGGVFA